METTAGKAQLIMRIVRFGFIAFSALLIFLVFKLPAPSAATPNPVAEVAISIVALTNIALGFFAPRFLLSSARMRSRHASTSTPVQRWLSGCILSLALFESCVLFAFVLHQIGARERIVETLFGLGMISLLFWNPGTPPSDEDRSASRE